MEKPSIAVLLGGHGHDDMAHTGSDLPSPEEEEEYDDLTPEEIDEKEQECGEELIEAIKSGDVAEVIKCFKALHGLDHATWDHEEKKETPEEESAEEEEPEPEEQ